MNLVLVEPAGTMTEDGTTAHQRLEASETVAPLGPATPFRVTVPVEDVPPATVPGETLRDTSAAAVMVRFAVCWPLPRVAVIVAVVVVDTADVLTVNVVELEPAGTVTVFGTVAPPTLEARLTLVPPVGALPFNVRVPVEEAPPYSVDGVRLRLDSAGALTVNWAVADRLPTVAVIVAGVAEDTGDVVTVNVADA